MKIKFKIETASGRKKIEFVLLSLDGFESFMPKDEHYNLEEHVTLSSEELTSIVFTDLSPVQLEKIKAVTKPYTDESPRGVDAIPLLQKSTLGVRALEEQIVNDSYHLRIYIEPIVLIDKEMVPYGNFEFLLDFEHHYHQYYELVESYLHWRDAICEQFPDLDLIKQFNIEEKLGVKKAELFACQIGLNTREKIARAGLLSLGLFDPAENIQIEKEKLEIEADIKDLKQQRM